MPHPLIRDKTLKSDILVVCALCAVAVAQPLYDVLGNGAAFFIAHDAGRFEILIFVLTLSIALPALIIFIELIAGLFGPSVRRVFHYSAVALLAWAYALGTLNKFTDANSVLVLAGSGLLGLILALLIAKLQSVRNITAIVSFAVILLPALFLFMTPVSRIVLAGDKVEGDRISIDSVTPVVLVIFDEFTLLGLLDRGLQIDPIRFPNIALLAKDSWWFPNASSVHHQSARAVPAILTGNFPPDEERVPSIADYPNNVFTLFGGSYALNVMESFTALCPKVYCTPGEDTSNFSLGAFSEDIRVLLAHIYYPKALAKEKLPSLDAGWKNFSGRRTNDDLANERRTNLKHSDKLQTFRKFVADIKPHPSTLDAIHVVLPHGPYEYLPDGRTYKNVPASWDTRNQADQAYQRYLMQLGVADMLMGDLLTRLKSIGKYDNALIIMVADHGLGFKVGVGKRSIIDNAAVLHIPLLIKLPNQKEGRISDRFVTNIDVIPTIADVLDIDLPWDVDGFSVFDENAPKREGVRVFFQDIATELSQSEIIDYEAIPDRLKKFGERTPLENLVIRGANSDLIGKTVAELINLPGYGSSKPKLSANLDEFSNVKHTSGYLPVMFKGNVVMTGPLPHSSSIAIALNGKVSAVAPLTTTQGTLEFSLLLPPADLIDGHNQLQAFLIVTDEPGETSLREITINEDTYTIVEEEDGLEVLKSGSGERFVVTENKFRGSYRVSQANGSLKLIGWAADPPDGESATKILMFANGEYVESAYTGPRTPGLVKRFKNRKLKDSRFQMDIPPSIWEAYPRPIRVFGLHRNGKAIELDE